jgi:hypothetical protein
MYKEVISEKENTPRATPPTPRTPYRTIRFRYYGSNTDLWQNLRKLLLEDKPSKKRTSFLESWAKNADLNHLPRCESAIGSSNIEGKDLRIRDTRDPQDIQDIIITNINSGHSYDDPYKKEWTNHELGEVVKAFKRSVPFEGTVTGTLEIHLDD